MVGAPIAFVYGNCVFAQGLDDGWAAFAVQASSYAWLSEEGKRARFLALIGAIEAIEADVQILRVCRRWEPERYARGLREESDPGRACAQAHARARERYVEEHVRRLGDVGVAQPAVFLLVSLRDPERDVASYVSRAAGQHPREWWEGLRRALSMRDKRVLKASELERARVRADQAHSRLADYLPVRQARGVELQWLVRRAFCRGLGEPVVDGLHEPRALVFERNGEAVLAPLEGDVMRWADGYVEHRGRTLKIESELGTSWQAQLVMGALPERMQFPGATRRADVRAGGKPAVRHRPVAERALPAQRAGAEDRAATDPGRRSDRAGGVRRRAGGVRPRVRAHAGGEGPARLPAGVEQAAAAARDAGDRGGGGRRGGAGGARGDVQAGLR